MNTKEMIEVIQAYEDGKTIECHPLDPLPREDKWKELDVIDERIDIGHGWHAFNFQSLMYRIKPEPKKIPLGPEDITPTTWIKTNTGKYKIHHFNEKNVYLSPHLGYSYEELMTPDWRISTTPDKFEWKPAYKYESIKKIFHGGCINCKSQSIHGINRCYECQYHDGDWSKPDLFIALTATA